MTKSLLRSLRKYSPKKDIDPLENFITEAFAWILNNHSDFCKNFMEEVSIKMGKIDFETSNCKLKTQQNFNGVYPDMVCISNRKAIIFEHKAWSSLHENQLENYKNYAKEHFVKSWIVLITATKRQHFQEPDLALLWSDIYRNIESWVNKNRDASFIFSDFLELLRDEGMGPPAPVSHQDILHYYPSVELEINLKNIVKHVLEQEAEKWIIQSNNPEQKDSILADPVYQDGWGRIGLQLLSSKEPNTWCPGVFVGALLDGKDHRVKPLTQSRGPDFCLIISFNNKLHNCYSNDENYRKLIENVRKFVELENNGWNFYHHLDDTAVKANKWHPVHIRKPMLDVFAGTITFEEQVNAFTENAKWLVEAVTREQDFWKLKDRYKPN